jgi:hypothetical protein
MMQEAQIKYIKPSYIIKDLRGDPKVRWKDDVKNDTRRMGMKWRKVAQGRVGWRCWGGAYSSCIVDPHVKRKILPFFPLPSKCFVLRISMVTREDKLGYHGLGI